jgi:hypothetical protein
MNRSKWKIPVPPHFMGLKGGWLIYFEMSRNLADVEALTNQPGSYIQIS